MTARVWRWRWREVKRRPVLGNSPNDRILRGPDCNRPKRVYADSFPATPSPQTPTARQLSACVFSGMAESIGPMWSLTSKPNPGSEAVPPPVGRPRAQVKERVGRITPSSSSAMSSGRLFLDRVARQHCPSPLHRRDQTNMRFISNQRKQDISTLLGIGHFYFALTPARSLSTLTEKPGRSDDSRVSGV